MTEDELRRALAAIGSELDDPTRPAREVYERAGAMVALLRAACSDAAEVRSRAAQRIRDEEGLSLAQLGQVLGVSKERAAQLVRAAARG